MQKHQRGLIDATEDNKRNVNQYILACLGRKLLLGTWSLSQESHLGARGNKPPFYKVLVGFN